VGSCPLNNELFLKQTQVLVVTLMVAIIVIALKLLKPDQHGGRPARREPRPLSICRERGLLARRPVHHTNTESA
jgi:hypothetical protein